MIRRVTANDALTMSTFKRMFLGFLYGPCGALLRRNVRFGMCCTAEEGDGGAGAGGSGVEDDSLQLWVRRRLTISYQTHILHLQMHELTKISRDALTS